MHWKVRMFKNRAKEKIDRFIADHLPRSVAMWTFIRVITYNNNNGPGPEIVAAMKRWEGKDDSNQSQATTM